jgi:hypothetical protein
LFALLLAKSFADILHCVEKWEQEEKNYKLPLEQKKQKYAPNIVHTCTQEVRI